MVIGSTHKRLVCLPSSFVAFIEGSYLPYRTDMPSYFTSEQVEKAIGAYAEANKASLLGPLFVAEVGFRVRPQTHDAMLNWNLAP